MRHPPCYRQTQTAPSFQKNHRSCLVDFNVEYQKARPQVCRMSNSTGVLGETRIGRLQRPPDPGI